MARCRPKAHIVYLVRHGESEGNERRVFLPPPEDDLTKNGELQAELLGKYLSKENVTRVYSSDYLRAYHTAEAIVKSSKNCGKLEIKTDVRLRERAVGEYEGKSYEDAVGALLKSGGDLMTFSPRGAERLKDVAKRMSNFFKELCSELDKQDVNKKKKEEEDKDEDELASSDEEKVVIVVSHSFALIKLIDYLIKSKSFKVVGWDQSKGYKLLRNGSFIKLAVTSLKDNCEDMTTLAGQRKIEFLALHETQHLKSLVEQDTLVKLTTTSEEAKAFSGCIQS